ncbi:hypothetical protein Dimus_020155 [Dionaea muscipula]
MKLAESIEIYGPKRWKKVASKAGLNRCGKSCRLRWMNYLRPNIKRGNISDQEEDLILRLHKLLGNSKLTGIGRHLPSPSISKSSPSSNSSLLPSPSPAVIFSIPPSSESVISFGHHSFPLVVSFGARVESKNLLTLSTESKDNSLL